MECPYCNGEMVKGHIYGDNYKMKWLPEDKKLFLGIWAKGGIELGESGWIGRPKIKAYMCKTCNKIIIDVEQNKG
ncbi:PF20097 family protein [Clostridium autoethanogenum]|uniref:PF20097 family protein n=1 Tax=Clostridium autoethanogenum DSM 10061 TaxID=1341692 RepID=A0ABN4BBZ6_9CLOT|nr:PF20097 family protein [Clostridium autoethanogenum]AGY75206.1 PF20097 family protein [Clostridium autoethanogenum DSM 10061]ALU35376.1 hypothetical protein CLAU_0947 [Clostridium autoethanogenum DSM 10061]OVY49545.1 hypothetical protein WX72_03470 [Clostridium autoethanogenum]